MRRCLYSCPTTLLQTSPPQSVIWHATACPGAPQFSLVVVEHWHADADQDAWEDQPGVNEHYPENLGQIVPATLVTAFGPWGVLPTDTIRQALKKIRAQWSAARL